MNANITTFSQPGPPNSATQDGYGSMMEVAYVAHYLAN